MSLARSLIIHDYVRYVLVAQAIAFLSFWPLPFEPFSRSKKTYCAYSGRFHRLDIPTRIYQLFLWTIVIKRSRIRLMRIQYPCPLYSGNGAFQIQNH